MPTWFRTSPGNAQITPVEVLSITSQFVTLAPEGRRVAKSGTFERYFPTWEDAHDYLMLAARNDVGVARRRLELANAFLGNVKGLRRARDVEPGKGS